MLSLCKNPYGCCSATVPNSLKWEDEYRREESVELWDENFGERNTPTMYTDERTVHCGGWAHVSVVETEGFIYTGTSVSFSEQRSADLCAASSHFSNGISGGELTILTISVTVVSHWRQFVLPNLFWWTKRETESGHETCNVVLWRRKVKVGKVRRGFK